MIGTYNNVYLNNAKIETSLHAFAERDHEQVNWNMRAKEIELVRTDWPSSSIIDPSL